MNWIGSGDVTVCNQTIQMFTLVLTKNFYLYNPIIVLPAGQEQFETYYYLPYKFHQTKTYPIRAVMTIYYAFNKYIILIFYIFELHRTSFYCL